MGGDKDDATLGSDAPVPFDDSPSSTVELSEKQLRHWQGSIFSRALIDAHHFLRLRGTLKDRLTNVYTACLINIVKNREQPFKLLDSDMKIPMKQCLTILDHASSLLGFSVEQISEIQQLFKRWMMSELDETDVYIGHKPAALPITAIPVTSVSDPLVDSWFEKLFNPAMMATVQYIRLHGLYRSVLAEIYVATLIQLFDRNTSLTYTNDTPLSIEHSIDVIRAATRPNSGFSPAESEIIVDKFGRWLRNEPVELYPLAVKLSRNVLEVDFGDHSGFTIGLPDPIGCTGQTGVTGLTGETGLSGATSA